MIKNKETQNQREKKMLSKDNQILYANKIKRLWYEVNIKLLQKGYKSHFTFSQKRRFVGLVLDYLIETTSSQV